MRNLLEATLPEADTYLVSLNLFQSQLLSLLISVFFRLVTGVHFPFPHTLHR